MRQTRSPVHSPKLFVESHVIGYETYVKDVRGAFKFCSVQFSMNELCSDNGVESDYSVVVAVQRKSVKRIEVGNNDIPEPIQLVFSQCFLVTFIAFVFLQ